MRENAKCVRAVAGIHLVSSDSFFLAFFTQRVDETKSMPGRGVRGAAPVRLCAMTRRFKKLYGQSAAQTPRLC